MKTLILGGSGDLAEQFAKEMRRFDIEIETRKLKPNPNLEEELLPFPIVINASDMDCSEIAAFCLAENIVFIETQSIEKNINKLRGLKVNSPSGTVVMGGGAFTGLGNLLTDFLEKGKASLSISPSSLGKARKLDKGFHIVDADQTNAFFRFFIDLFSPPGAPVLVANHDGKSASLKMKDTVICGGLSLGAMVLEIIEGRDIPTGIHPINNIFFLESNLSLIDAISPDALESNLG